MLAATVAAEEDDPDVTDDGAGATVTEDSDHHTYEMSMSNLRLMFPKTDNKMLESTLQLHNGSVKNTVVSKHYLQCRDNKF